MIVKTLQANFYKPKATVSKEQGFMAGFVIWSWRILLPAAFLQCFFTNTPANLFAVFVILSAWKLTTAFVLRPATFYRYPLSCFVILCYALTQFCFPLLFTLLEAKPVIFNLSLPYDVFLHSLLCIIVVVGAHAVYRSLNRTRYNNGLQKLLWGAGLYKPPTDKQIWMMGVAGLLALLYSVLGRQAGQDFSGNSNKFIEGFILFAYAPYYLLLKPLYGNGKIRSKNTMVLLAIYTLLIFIVSIMRNSRGAFMYGFTGIGYSYLLGLLLNVFPAKFLSPKKIFLALSAVWLVTGPLSDLGVAMLVARAQRTDVPATEVLSQTLALYNDKEALRMYKLQTTGTNTGEFDEAYLNNLYLARFCNLKYNDLSLQMAQRLKGVDPLVKRFSVARPLAAILPTPLLHLFGLEIDKEYVISFSYGDYLIDRVGWKGELGSFMVGHFAGFGMASFGWWYLVILFVLMIPSFFLWDAFAVFTKNKQGGTKIIFSLAGLVLLIFGSQFITVENVFSIAEFLFRNWLQMVVLYLLLFHVTKPLVSLLPQKKK